MDSQKVIIGREEWCALPVLSIPAIRARIDSGAKTSAIHAINIECFHRNEQLWVSFDILPIQNNSEFILHGEAEVFAQRSIKSSNGSVEKRYVIKTQLRLGNLSRDIQLTLTNRETMDYRMLLGREAMSGVILVDPGAVFNCGRISNAELQQLYTQNN